MGASSYCLVVLAYFPLVCVRMYLCICVMVEFPSQEETWKHGCVLASTVLLHMTKNAVVTFHLRSEATFPEFHALISFMYPLGRAHWSQIALSTDSDG